MSKTKKYIVYSVAILLYGVIMVSLMLNNFIPLILVPCVALSWATIVLVGFIKDRKRFKADIDSDAKSEWKENAEEYNAVYQEEPHDTEWLFETIALIGFVGMWIIYLIVGFMAR